METICAHMSRSHQNGSTFTRILGSQLLDLTLSFLQVISQSLVFIQNSDYNNKNEVTIKTNKNTTNMVDHFFTAEILTCHSRRSSGVINNINDGCTPFRLAISRVLVL